MRPAGHRTAKLLIYAAGREATTARCRRIGAVGLQKAVKRLALGRRSLGKVRQVGIIRTDGRRSGRFDLIDVKGAVLSCRPARGGLSRSLPQIWAGGCNSSKAMTGRGDRWP